MFFITKYSESNTVFKDLFEFFEETEKWFNPPISSRKPLAEYVRKLLTEAKVILAKDSESKDIIGLAAYYCTPNDFDYAFLSYIASISNQKGVGSALVLYMIRDCRESGMLGVETQTWESNEKSIGLFKKNGFKVIGTAKNRDTIDSSILLKLEF